MEALATELKQHIRGDIHFDTLSRKIYSVDASIFEIEPLGIVIPKDKQDLIQILQIAAKHRVAAIPRGAATGITGGCLGHGLIIDVSKYLNHILEINIEKEYVVCEPGVVQDRLNDALLPFGYRLGPDTSTGNRATIGGMLANNAAGARSLHYGRMVDQVESVELALADGRLITCEALNEHQWEAKLHQPDAEGHIYREVARLQKHYRKEIQERFPKIPRHVSGYNLDQLLMGPPVNLAKLIAGSEGTLGIATAIKLRIAKILKHTGLCVIHIDDMIQGMQHIKNMLSFHPTSLEMIDHKILEAGRLSPNVRNKLEWLQGNPQAVFVAEFSGDSDHDVDEKLDSFSDKMNSLRIGYAHTLLRNPQDINNVWDVRKAGLGLLLSKRTYSRAVAFIEDISVAPEHLASFMQEFCSYLKHIGKEAGIYGHIGSGCMHIRPYIDLRKPEEVSQMIQIMSDISDILHKYGGSLSGEHGDGLIRSWLNEKMFGNDLYQAFLDLKTAFDPLNLMNPGKIVNGPAISEKNLRLNPQIKQAAIPTFLDFTAEGGFELAADLCNGNGQCRKAEKVMCPSFQATNDEYDTTRARAQSLRAVINGRLPIEELTSDAIYDVLDLCLECKGCKTECPSQVDMAKMKAEVLFQYQEKHGYFFRNLLFGHIHRINRLSSPVASMFNWISSSSIGKWLLNKCGITTERDLPKLSHERFSSWFKKQSQPKSQKKVVLFNDTYTEFNHPNIGKATYKILSGLGYEIMLISNVCCGRPLISKGLLPSVKSKAQRLVKELFPFASLNYPIIFLEPSCLSAIKDDFTGLIGSSNPRLASDLASVIQASTSLEEFLCSQLQDGRLELPFLNQNATVLFHGHCHQKSLTGTEPSLKVLRSIPGFRVQEINSGCCGLAGSFGYEKEHYDISMKIGNLHLLPAVRNAPPEAIIVANGMSCRSQIEHGSGRHALHLAEAVVAWMA